MKRKTLLAAALIAFGLAGFSYARYVVIANYERNKYFAEQQELERSGGIRFAGPYCHPDPHPPLLFKILLVVALICGSIAWTPSNMIPAGLSLYLTAQYGSWYSRTQQLLEYSERNLFWGIESYLYLATVHDIAVMTLVSSFALYFSAKSIRSGIFYITGPRSP
jgi:hypothetical protein